MLNLKRLLLLIAILAVAAVDICLYWNSHLYYRAKNKVEDTEKKITVLEKANIIYPFNDRVFYELGKAYFDLGVSSLEEKALRDTYFRKSIENFSKSLRINPASFFSHFSFAQSLLYMSYISPSSNINYHDEYKKAALLTGHNPQIFYEVGKILLSRWPALSEKERDFSLELLEKILIKKDKEKLQTIMQIWDLNVKDYEAMERILPEDSRVYRMYAQFLGEKSLSLEIRQKMLARAEFLDFLKVKEVHDSALRDLQYYQLRDAFRQFKHCLNSLKRINFYQGFTPKELINLSEFRSLYKSVNLNLAKCLLEEGHKLTEVESYLRTYLELEDELPAIRELEAFLRDRDLIRKGLEAKFDDLERLSFQIFLYFKNIRYRDIVRIGRLLQQSFIVVPEERKRDFVEVLQLVGDSFQKIDFVYDAGEFYQKALDQDPDNLKTLLRMRQNYEWLNYDEKVKEINERIKKLLTSEEIIPKNPLISKGRKYSQTLILDGKNINLYLQFKIDNEGINPLISVFFNGRVVWENYLKEDIITIPLETRVGKNTLMVSPVNRPINLVRITYK